MTTAQIASQPGAAHAAHAAQRAFAALPVASLVAAGIVALVAVGIVAQAADPLAYLVGMTPIAWIAIEGAWRLFR